MVALLSDLFGIQSYFTVASSTPARDIEGITSTVFRAADFAVYWGAPGVVDSVMDLTHGVTVPFASMCTYALRSVG